MDEIDKREKRAEYRNVRQTAGGKGDANNRITNQEYSESAYFCDTCGKGPSVCECKEMFNPHKFVNRTDKTATLEIEDGKITGVKYE